MSITVRPAAERGITRNNWLDSRHTFSFGHYHDEHHRGFGVLCVINEDWIAPGGGFAMHRHADMEIVTVVLEGALQHHDSLNNGSIIRPGEVQRMSAGSGIQHSEFNASKDTPVHLLQIWVEPERLHGAPEYAQQAFEADARQGQLQLWMSPDGAQDSLRWRQDARLYGARLASGERIQYRFSPGRQGWVQVARGALTLDGIVLRTGDGAAIAQHPNVLLSGGEAQADGVAELLLFDLP